MSSLIKGLGFRNDFIKKGDYCEGEVVFVMNETLKCIVKETWKKSQVTLSVTSVEGILYTVDTRHLFIVILQRRDISEGGKNYPLILFRSSFFSQDRV